MLGWVSSRVTWPILCNNDAVREGRIDMCQGGEKDATFLRVDVLYVWMEESREFGTLKGSPSGPKWDKLRYVSMRA